VFSHKHFGGKHLLAESFGIRTRHPLSASDAATGELELVNSAQPENYHSR